jgi:hypothetical protein
MEKTNQIEWQNQKSNTTNSRVRAQRSKIVEDLPASVELGDSEMASATGGKAWYKNTGMWVDVGVLGVTVVAE